MEENKMILVCVTCDDYDSGDGKWWLLTDDQVRLLQYLEKQEYLYSEFRFQVKQEDSVTTI